MAKIKYSALVQEMRGKLNGSVASRNKAGNYFRNKTTPVNPNTTAQAMVRSQLTTITQSWRGLTEDQRNGWNSVTEQYQRNNIFGDKVKLSGMALYSRLNLNLLQIAAPTIPDAPLPAEVPNFSSVSVEFDNTAGTAVLTYAPAIPAGTRMLLRATPGMSPGISFAKNKLRVIGYLVTANASPYDFAAMYIAKFGSIPPAGTKVFVDVEPVVMATGQDGINLQASTIVV